MKLKTRWLLASALAVLVVGGVGAFLLLRRTSANPLRDERVLAWIRKPQDHAEWAVAVGSRCGTAPFQLPTSGYIGYLWGDSFQIGHSHQGIDIFGGAAPLSRVGF
jgi:hypothetical protein